MSKVYAADITDTFCTNLVRMTAQSLVDDGVYPPGDRADVIQELTIVLFERQGDFDPERGKWSTFVKQVVTSKTVSFRRKQGADCRRDGLGLESLSTRIADEDGQQTELGYTVREDQDLCFAGQRRRSDVELLELGEGLATVIDQLPADLAALCERLKTQSLSEIAEELGMPRSTLANRLARIRAAFERGGLRDAL